MTVNWKFITVNNSVKHKISLEPLSQLTSAKCASANIYLYITIISIYNYYAY